MKKYLYIIKNSFLEVNHSYFIMAMQMLQPLGEIYGFILLYSYILNPQAGLNISSEIAIYYLFILTASTSVLPMFSERIRKDIIDDTYLNIEKLPINPAVFYFLDNVAKNIIPMVVFIFGSVIYMIISGVPAIAIGLFVPTLLLSIVLSHLIYFVFTMSNFYSETASVWLFRAIFDFTSGRWVPLLYIPTGIRYFLYALPFPYAFGALARNFAQFNVYEYGISVTVALIWTIVLGIIGTKLWHRGSYHFQENG